MLDLGTNGKLFELYLEMVLFPTACDFASEAGGLVENYIGGAGETYRQTPKLTLF